MRLLEEAMVNISPSIRSVISRDGAVILDVKRGAMLNLNSMGGYIWERLQQGRSIDDIIQEIVQETSADQEQVERDVHEFLEQLKSRQLITVPASGKDNDFYGPK